MPRGLRVTRGRAACDERANAPEDGVHAAIILDEGAEDGEAGCKGGEVGFGVCPDGVFFDDFLKQMISDDSTLHV